MKNISILPGITIFLVAVTSCTGNAPTSTPATDADAVATIVAATLTAFPTAIPTSTEAAPKLLSFCRFGATSSLATTNFAPLNGKGAIAYSSDSLQEGLTLIFPDTGEIVPLHQLRTHGLVGTDMSISWSPDGTKIAFLYSESWTPRSESYLMLADLLLGEICPIVNVQARYGRPVWSPDGDKLTFVDFGNSQLKLIKLDDGSELTIAVNVFDASFDEARPMWLDSEHVVYIRATETEFVTDLVNQPIDGSVSTVVLEKVSGLRDFSFSVDGKWLAYSVRGNIILRNLQTGSEQNLGDDLSSPYWSPDSNYLLGKAGLSAIWLIQPNSSDQITVLNFFGCLGNEPWASDSQRFAVLLCADGSKSTKIAVYDLNTTELQELPIEDLAPSFPAWNNH